jgi:hypothetical protein
VSGRGRRRLEREHIRRRQLQEGRKALRVALERLHDAGIEGSLPDELRHAL